MPNNECATHRDDVIDHLTTSRTSWTEKFRMDDPSFVAGARIIYHAKKALEGKRYFPPPQRDALLSTLTKLITRGRIAMMAATLVTRTKRSSHMP